MTFRPHLARLLFAGAGLLAFAPWVAAGPVQYTSQTRRIEATLTEEYLVPDGDPDRRTGSASQAAPDFGPFDATVTATVEDRPPGRPTGQNVISQRSALADSGISAEGNFNGFTGTDGGEFTSLSLVDVTFVLDEVRNFTLGYAMEVPSFYSQIDGEVSLTRVGGAAVFDEDLDFTQNPIDDTGAFGSRTGTLTPGEYRFVFRHSYETDTGDDADYSVSLALTPSGNGEPNPIPLPPAAWAALATTGGFGALRGCRRWFARRRQRE